MSIRDFFFKPPKGEANHHQYHSHLERKLQPILTPFKNFTKNQLLASLMLLTSTVLAVMFASSNEYSDIYYHLVNIKFGFHFHEFEFIKPLKFWVNNVLLTFFFFLVGLEIKREFLAGELQNLKAGFLIILAAVGGMVMPALLFFVVNVHSPSAIGFGIPMATDTAFALGILICFRGLLPEGVFTFIAALAIIDDIGAILVIALFYSNAIHFMDLAIAGVIWVGLLLMNYAGVRKLLPYLLLGACLWFFIESANVHGTIAGILVAFSIPARPERGPSHLTQKMKSLIDYFEKPGKDIPKVLADVKQHSILIEMADTANAATTPVQRFETRLEKPITFFVLPLFAFLNAGICLKASLFSQMFSNTLSMGILLGLLIGKPLGISFMSYLGLRLNIGHLPKNINFKHIMGISLIAGIGFTMSLFIASTAFSHHAQSLELAKFSIFVSSILAGTFGIIFLLSFTERKEDTCNLSQTSTSG